MSVSRSGVDECAGVGGDMQVQVQVQVQTFVQVHKQVPEQVPG